MDTETARDEIDAPEDWRRARRRAVSVPFIEDEPTDREEQPCWCTDFHLDVGLNLTYCPRHGREPDPDLMESAPPPADPRDR